MSILINDQNKKVKTMSKLKFKTRGNTSPQGKPKVYFCCHPNNFEKYFEPISSEILAKQNCSIWYCEEPYAEYDEEILSDLLQMQLFVMPVTTTLLCTPNNAIDIEFKFAIENHIPVLPLMQEDGLDEVFNKKCGDLQFLDKNNQDSTAISYDEKLDKYLSSVLIGDELAEKIRAAFDAYVFLSYRKKDRKYAQELMKLIHKNDFCRDIAIWYDEFLVPGENFNDSIELAIRKSDLFALVVTPNLVNEENYVMSIEYPMAKELGKTILPAELVPTDKNKIRAKYDGFPECTNALDEKELSEAMLSSLKSIAIKENVSDPQHNFFIGLAYLSGIDVEINHQRAIGLITSAAEYGLAEAFEKLVSMYQKGEGVKRDYFKSVEWQEKYVNILEERFNKSLHEEDEKRWLRELFNLANTLKNLHEHNKAKKLLLTGCQACEDFVNRFNDLENQNILTGFYDRLYGIFSEEGNEKEKNKYTRKISNLLGNQIENEKESLASLESEYFLSLLSGYIVTSEFGNSDDRIRVPDSLKIAEKIYNKYNTGQSRLSKEYVELAKQYQNKGNSDKAAEYSYKAIKLYDELFEQTNDPEDYRQLCKGYTEVLSFLEENQDDEKFQEYSEKLFYLYKELSEDTGSLEDCIKLCEFCLERELNKKKRTELRERLLSQYIIFADKCRAEEVFEKAAEMYKKALRIRTAITDETRSTASKRELSLIYEKLGDVYKNKGEFFEAEEMCLKGLEISYALAKEVNTIESKRDLSISYNILSNIYKAASNFNKSKQLCMKGIEIREDISKETDTLQAKRDLFFSYGKLGSICIAECNLTDAEKAFLKSIELGKLIANETSDAKDWDSVASSCYVLALLDESNIKEEYMQKAYNIWKDMANKYPDNSDFSKKRDIASEYL